MAAAIRVYLRKTLIVAQFQRVMEPVQLFWKPDYIGNHLTLLFLRLYVKNVAVFAAKKSSFFAQIFMCPAVILPTRMH